MIKTIDPGVKSFENEELVWICVSVRASESIVDQGPLSLLKIVWFELGTTALLSLLCLLADRTLALSVFLGGLTCIVPNTYQALRFTRALNQGAGIGALIAGEVGKWVLTASMFVLVFKTIDQLNPLQFFIAFAAFQLIHLSALHYFKAGRVHINGR